MKKSKPITQNELEAIRESVRTRLARRETPRAIVFVDALPMTATGKIMRRELRERAPGD